MMQKTTLNRITSKSFSNFANEFIYNPSTFKELINLDFSLENFEKQITQKQSFSTERRSILHKILTQNYSNTITSLKTKTNIDSLLDENTFTVTTGHQLNIFTGPIFFIYKILHTIKLTEQLNERYPNKHFVPIYWMASEDHDFEEINHTSIFNQNIQWNTEQAGPVGRFELNDWDEVVTTVQAFFQSHPDSPIHDLLNNYKGNNLSEATFQLVNSLFKSYGLVILDADHHELKSQFSHIMVREISEQFSEKCVLEANEKLEKLGYKPQIFARPINLFYINSGFRERIILEDGVYSTSHLGQFSKEQLITQIKTTPESFSPNVVLRPVYQETILPNLAYIGGAAEIHYWTQLKGVFDTLTIPFPILQVRNSLQIFDKNARKKLVKLGLNETEIFEETQQLKAKFVQKNASHELNFSSLEEQSHKLQSEISSFVHAFDSNLSSFAEAENMKIIKQIEALKNKLTKLQKAQFDTELNLIEDLKNKLFPNGGLQERKENFLSFCPTGNYAEFLSELYEHIDPLEKDLIVLSI